MGHLKITSPVLRYKWLTIIGRENSELCPFPSRYRLVVIPSGLKDGGCVLPHVTARGVIFGFMAFP